MLYYFCLYPFNFSILETAKLKTMMYPLGNRLIMDFFCSAVGQQVAGRSGDLSTSTEATIAWFLSQPALLQMVQILSHPMRYSVADDVASCIKKISELSIPYKTLMREMEIRLLDANLVSPEDTSTRSRVRGKKQVYVFLTVPMFCRVLSNVFVIFVKLRTKPLCQILVMQFSLRSKYS